MGKIQFSNCQDVRNQKKIQELDCPRCHEPGGIEAFVKDGILAEDGVCDNCGYILPEGTELCMPGDNVVMEVELLAPIAIENGTKFSIREGGRTVGSGSITEIEA